MGRADVSDGHAHLSADERPAARANIKQNNNILHSKHELRFPLASSVLAVSHTTKLEYEKTCGTFRRLHRAERTHCLEFTMYPDVYTSVDDGHVSS